MLIIKSDYVNKMIRYHWLKVKNFDHLVCKCLLSPCSLPIMIWPILYITIHNVESEKCTLRHAWNVIIFSGARTNKTEITDMNANISTPDGTKHSQCGNFDLPVLENNVLTFSSEEEKEVAINMVDIDIESYLPTARPLILQAIYGKWWFIRTEKSVKFTN